MSAVRDARRGASPGEFELTCSDGRVLIAVAYGVDDHERERVRESLLAALAATGVEVHT